MPTSSCGAGAVGRILGFETKHLRWMPGPRRRLHLLRHQPDGPRLAGAVRGKVHTAFGEPDGEEEFL